MRARWRAMRERRLQRRTAGHKLLRAFGEAYPAARFIEIGAGDGLTGDHLRPFIVSRPWQGIMVEPVPYVFEQLRRNYAGSDRVTLENVAIAGHDGTIPFHYFVEATGEERERLPEQYHLVGSRSREMLLRQAGVPDRERRIVSAEVPCMSFESLCRKHGVDGFDLVLVDAEGYDCEIVKEIDVPAIRPRILVYEDAHLSADERAECEGLLEALGYRIMVEGFDAWCLDARRDDALTETWTRLCEAGPIVSREQREEWFAGVLGQG